MSQFAVSKDGVKVYYEQSGRGDTALLFSHGWLGNSRWWDAQRDFFSDRFTILQLDLGGHGKSGERSQPSAERYAEDIVAVARQVETKNLVLVGHSMSGAYILEASFQLPNTQLLVPVDTLKNLDQLLTPQQAEEYIFQPYRKEKEFVVKKVLPQFLSATGTPPAVRERLMKEFLSVDPEKGARLLAPLYEMDVRAAAKRIAAPVRAINADFSPTSLEANRKYFRDFDYVSMHDVGHYPMLERPDEFNAHLDSVLKRSI